MAQQNWQAEFDYQKQQDALAMQLAQSKARGGGSSGGSKSSEEGRSGNPDKYGGYKYSYLVDLAKEMVEKTDDNNEYLYDSGAVLQSLKDLGVSDRDEREKIVNAAGGNFEIGRYSKS